MARTGGRTVVGRGGLGLLAGFGASFANESSRLARTASQPTLPPPPGGARSAPERPGTRCRRSIGWSRCFGGAMIRSAPKRHTSRGPSASWPFREWGWQYVFPRERRSVDPRSGAIRRRHRHESGLRKAVKKAANCHALRHSFAAHWLETGYAIRTVRELLGHSAVSTTLIHTHILHRGGQGRGQPAGQTVT